MQTKHIVLVEDDIDIRESIQAALEVEGYQVTVFVNGRVAIDNLENVVKPNLILLDIMMPELDGWGFMEIKRSMPAHLSAIPVIIVSAVSDPAKVNDSGAQGYIKKPLDLNALLKVIQAY